MVSAGIIVFVRAGFVKDIPVLRLLNHLTGTYSDGIVRATIMKSTFLFKPRGALKVTGQIVAGLLMVSFFISPFQVLAEEQVESGSTTESSEAHSSVPETTGEESAPVEEGGSSMSLLSEDNGSQLDIGKTPVNTNLRFEPNAFDGSLQYDFPLTIPPGRNGLQPSLSLQYSSRPSRESNLFGYGWSISIPYIERRNYMGVEELYDHQAFYSSLSGELASTSVATVYKAKVEISDYLNYTFSGNTWTVTDRAGTTYKFGHASSTQQYVASSTQEVYKWMLQEVRDTNDNYITYSYTKDSNQIYPDVITYTGNGGAAGNFDVHFTKELRSDIATSTAEGFEVVTKYRINEIKAEVNDSWVRKYTLGYGTGDNGLRSVLTSIVEAGYDGVSTTTLPTALYDYQDSVDSWTQNGSWDIPVPVVDENYVDEGVRIAEANGDGLPDLLRNDGNNNEVLLNTGSGWTYTSAYQNPIVFRVPDVVHPGHMLIDINGDGLTDIAKSIENMGTSTIYMNTGHGWTLSSSTVPVAFAKSNGGDNGVRVADVNGDGLPDLVRNHQGDGGGGNKVYINQGSTWELDTSWVMPEYTILNDNVTDPGTRVVDINGDGLADVLQRNETDNQVYLNNGNGWTLSSTTVPVKFMDDGVDQGTRLEDVNGDGLIDILQRNASANVVYLNTGGAWTQDSSWSIPTKIVDTVSSVVVDAGSRFADFNGDGLLDELNYIQGGTDYVYLRNGEKPDLLATSTNQLGGVTSITYKGSPEYTGLNPYTPYALDTVQKVLYNDGIGTWDTEYAYQDGIYYTDILRDRKFSGFGLVTATDDLGYVTKQYFHQGSTTSSSIGEYDDHIAKIGKVFRTEVYDNSSNLYTKTINKWDRYDRSDGASFVKLAEVLDFSYDGDSDHKEKADAYTYNNTYGNTTLKVNYGEVSGSNDGTFSDSGSDKFTSVLTYATSTATSTVYALSQETISDQSSNKVREKKVYFDTLSFGSLNKGNLTKEERWKAASTYIDVEKTYNGYGLVTQDKNARDKITTYTYDAFNLYPATTTNPLSQVIEKLYDYSSGKVATTTDPNGRVFVTVYDSLDRVIAEKQPDITAPSTLVTKNVYQYTDSVFPRKVQKTSYLNSATTTDSYFYSDGYGKKLQERGEVEESNTFGVKDYRYDSRGLLKTESLPYFETGTSYTGTSTPPTSTLLLRYAYDPLQRISASGNSVGTTTYAYDDWKTTTTDAEGSIKDFISDAYGNLTQVIEHNDGSSYTTSYEYNGNNNLTKITDDASNIRNFTYDGLGRRLTAQDLHDSGDGTYGTWTYTYDDTGNVSSVVDPKSQTIDFAYDDLNRALTENYAGSAGTEITYIYDDCSEGEGRLCTASTTDALSAYAYNAIGLPSTETRTIGGVAYTATYTYDRLGNILTLANPDNSAIRYFYNDAGQLETVEQNENGGSYSFIISNFDYGPTGKITFKEFGNGVTSTYTYDATKLYRLTNIITLPPSGESLMGGGGELSYNWSPLYETTENPIKIARAKSFPYAAAILEEDPSLFEEFFGPSEEGTSGPVPSVEEPSGEVLGDISSSTPEEVQESVPPEIVPEEETATTTQEEPVIDPIVPTLPEQAVLEVATTTDTLPEPAIDYLKFRAPIEKHLGTKEYEDGTVKYAYRTDTRVEEVSLGREVLSAARVNDVAITNEVIEARTSHARTFATDNPGVFITEIVSGEPQYYEDENGEWWQADYATTTRESYDEQAGKTGGGVVGFVKRILNRVIAMVFGERVFATTSTFYPDPNTETSTVDGVVMRVNVQESFSTKRNGAGNAVDDSTSPHIPAQISDGTSTNWKHMTRGIFLFDTSSIPDTHTVASATFSLKRNASSQDTYSQSVSLTSSNPASNTSLASSDYGNVGTTLYATDVTIASMGVGSYTDWTLNSTGLSAISQTGITKLGTRIRSDIDNSDPGSNGSNSNGSYIEVYMAEASGTSNDPKLVVVHSTTPDVPTALLTEGQTNPTNVLDTTPEFSAIYEDTDAGDIATSYRIQVATTSTFVSMLWDTSKTTLASSTPRGMRIADISYGGTALASSTTHYWRIKFWDQSDVEGLWNTATSTFVLSPGQNIQNITFTYDNVGNIVTITDNSDTTAAKTIIYGYDDLYRLTSASTTVANSASFNHTYTYSSIGNISSSTPAGAYAYAETNYVNPHAPTTINGTSLGYDDNGNLTSYGTDLYGWNYRNRMASSTVSGLGATYGYDHTNQRVSKTMNGIPTVYPNQYFEKEGTATTTKYIWAGGDLIATVNGNGVSTTTEYSHSDHLGSTNVTTDEGGEVTSVLDYLPFGSERISTGDELPGRGYIGQFTDREQDLSYLQNRYYSSDRGQFTSQDPAFLLIGDPTRMQSTIGVTQDFILSDPQLLNSYSYARNNPITLKDPEGKIAFLPLLGYIYSAYTAAQISVDAYDVYNTNVRYGDVFTQQEKTQTNFKAGIDVALAVTGAKIAKDSGKAAGVAFDTLTATLDTLDTYLGDQIYKKANENRNSAQQNSSNNTQTNTNSSRQSSQYSPTNQGGGGGYNQLVKSLNSLVSSLKSYVSGLSTNKDKKK